MKGYLEHVSAGHIKGWAFDGKKPHISPKIRALVNNSVVAEGIASVDRPDVAKAFGVGSALCGFHIDISIDAGDVDSVLVQASLHGDKWVSIERIKKKNSYQDFDGTGASKSHEKLKALKLYDMNFGKSGADAPLQGKAVLDIGCNEGFFCAEAVRQGARRVLGIDVNKEFLEGARKRVPAAQFLQGSWWDLPNEKFDVIFFLSAIHYEQEQKRFLDKLVNHLTDDGVLILECGVKGRPGKKQWSVVKRWDGEKRYPSLDLLREELLSKYAVRLIGPSVAQAGDPVPRYVFHCKPRRPVAMIITGHSHSGKTALAQKLLGCGVPHYDSDTAIAKLLMDDEYAHFPLAAKLLSKFGKGMPDNIALVGNYIADSGLASHLAELVIKEIPREADLFTIEGEVFRHKIVQDALFLQLSKNSIRAWLVKRGS